MARHGNTRVVQDDRREEEMARILGTNWNSHREQADSFTDEGIELEFKSHSKPGVSTARDLGYKWLDRMSTRYWVLGHFTNHDSGHVWNKFRFMAPSHLKGWFDKIRARLDDDRNVSDQVISILQKSDADPSLIDRAAKLMKDGALLNDPNIPAKYIEANSVEIKEPYAEHLRQLIDAYPIETLPVIEANGENELDQYFVFSENG